MSQGLLRRIDKMMSPDDIGLMLDTAPLAHFGSVSASGDPYVVPNLFVHRTGKLFCHTGLAGHFRSNVMARPRVCFEISETGTVYPYGEFECDTSISYRSIIGFGSVRVAEETRDKADFFDMLMAKYGPSTGRPASFYPRLNQITVYTLSIDTVTGKRDVLPAESERWPAANRTKSPGAREA
jgi:nitroimidazol reductase NimA-like FMN-containing flavoprotein (pyridoxamine 5'-phosphate oxidase superfamily)